MVLIRGRLSVNTTNKQIKARKSVYVRFGGQATGALAILLLACHLFFKFIYSIL